MNLTENKIIFQQTRDIGEVVSTTFRFIRENFKTLMMGALYFTAPFFVIGGIFFVTAFNRMFLNSNIEIPENSFIKNGLFSMIFLFLGASISALGLIMQITYVNELIKFVANQKDSKKPTVTDIWKSTRKKFWMNILHSFVWLILTGIGSMATGLIYFLFIPIIMIGAATKSVAVIGFFMVIVFLLMFLIASYVYALTMPIFFIYTYENTNIFNAIGRSVSLMHLRKENFWGAIFSNAICIFIYFILSMNIILPMTLAFQFAKEFGGLSEDSFVYGNLRILIIVTGLITTFIQLFFLNIPLINTAIKYFDWVERVDGKGLIERIKTIGHNKDYDPSSYEESF